MNILYNYIKILKTLPRTSQKGKLTKSQQEAADAADARNTKQTELNEKFGDGATILENYNT